MGHLVCLAVACRPLSLSDRTHTCGYLAVGIWHRLHSAVLPGQSMALAVGVLGPVCQSVLACCFTGLGPFRKSPLFAWRSGCLDQISTLRRRLYVLAGNQPGPAAYDVCDNGGGHSHHGSDSGCRIEQFDFIVLNSPTAAIWSLWRPRPR